MRYFFVCALLFACAVASAQKPVYDSLLAQKLKGNANGMKSYIFVILKTGTYKPESKQVSDSLFKGHMSNMGRLAEEGKLIVAGPFGKNELGFRGIFIMDVKDIDEARQLVATDPAVKANVFTPEFLPWFGSASLMATPEIHERITRPK